MMGKKKLVKWITVVQLLIFFAVMVFGFLSGAFGLSPLATAPFYISSVTSSMNLPQNQLIKGWYLSDKDKTTLPIGSIILYDPRCAENLNTPICQGVKYWYGSARITHRIIGWDGHCYGTQGDNNEEPDGLCVKPAMVMFQIQDSEREGEGHKLVA
jgi:hypothetical protein